MKIMKGNIFGMGEDDSSFDKENLISLSKQTKNIYHLWLIDEIGEPKQYLKWYDILQCATEEDLVIIHINCYGGDLFTAIQIVTQIKTCSAQVVCQIESTCASAATMVALACDGMICYPHGYMMIHTSSGFSYGKQSDIKKQEDFYNPWLEDFFTEIYKHFLTKKEISEVLDGKDMWLNANDVMERFKKRVDIINRETNKAKREHMKKLQSFMSAANSQEVAAQSTSSELAKEPEKKEPVKKPAKRSGKGKKSTRKEKEKEVK
jgi:ATP-dependent protease ClpP protease subunit